MKLRLNYVPHIANRIGIEVANSNLVEVKTSIENIANISSEVLKENIAKEQEIEARAKDILEDKLEEIEFMRADERQLFWMVKRQIAQDIGFSLSREDRFSEISHKILDELILEGYVRIKVSENVVKNLIFRAIDTYAQAYEDIEGSVIEKIKNYKRKILVGTDEYELIFDQLYREELIRRGFL